MAVTQADVETFLAANKSVAGSVLTWRERGCDWLIWDASVESDGLLRGRLYLEFNRSVPNRYSFTLYLHRPAIYGWHFRPWGRHRNRRGCPPDFGTSARYPHEQKWIEGIGFECARLLPGIEGLSHREHLEMFCDRANINLQPSYRAPLLAEQTVMHFEEQE